MMMDNLAALAGLGEDPSDLDSDSLPYLRLLDAVTRPPDAATGGYLDLALRRLRTQRLTPGGLPQPPEVMGVDADARVPNVLQPMSGEYAGGRQVADGVPAFHNPTLPPSTGLATRETAPQGLLQQARAGDRRAQAALLAQLTLVGITPVGNERGVGAAPKPPAPEAAQP